jgi:exocyst complex component 4
MPLALCLRGREGTNSAVFVDSCLTPYARFVFEGLGQLMETLLIANARFIRALNGNGVKKMFRNILALQQNVKIISEGLHIEFERAKRYYSLFSKTPPVRIIHAFPV